MKKMILFIIIIISNTCYAQKIIKVVDQFVLIDTDQNIGNSNDVIIVQRMDIDDHIVNIGKIQIIKFVKGMTAAKVIHEYNGYKIKTGDYLVHYFRKMYDEKGVLRNDEHHKVSKDANICDMGVDLVSNYVWRGIQHDAAPNIQGWVELYTDSFFAGLFASTNLTGSYSETDIYVGFYFGNLTITITDYLWGTDDAFNFKRGETSHSGEISLQYTIGEDFPLRLTGAAVVYGDDMKLDSIAVTAEPYFSNNRNYSAYLELMYPVSLGSIDFELSLGGVTHESYYYDATQAAIINIGIKASKMIPISEKFKLPVSYQLTINPELESIYSTLSVSF